MGHRALVAYEQDDGTYNVHYSHWGALECQLAEPDALTKDHPYGKADITPDVMSDLLEKLGGADAEIVGGEATEDKDTAVDRDPHAVDVSKDELPELVTFDHECLYLVDTDFTVRAFVPKFIGLRAKDADDIELCFIETKPNRYDMVYHDIHSLDDETTDEYRDRLANNFEKAIPEWSPVR